MIFYLFPYQLTVTSPHRYAIISKSMTITMLEGHEQDNQNP